MIAAVSKDNVISRMGEIPWKVFEDMKFFKKTTTGYPIIMGRKTADTLKKPLVDRRNIILSKKGYTREGFESCRSLEDALDLCIGSSKVFIIGGGEIYNNAIDYADSMIISRIPKVCQLEDEIFYDEKSLIRFPEISNSAWDVVDIEYKETFKVEHYEKFEEKRLSRWK